MTHYNLRNFRLAKNLSQPEVADYLGVGKAFISQVEQGVSKLHMVPTSIQSPNCSVIPTLQQRRYMPR